MAVPVSWHIGSTPPGSDVRVLEKIVGDELVVIGRFRVVEDLAQLLEVRRPQQVVDVGEGRLRERAQRLALDHEHILAHHLLDLDAADIELAVGRLVRAERKQWGVFVGWDDLGRRVHGKLR